MSIIETDYFKVTEAKRKNWYRITAKSKGVTPTTLAIREGDLRYLQTLATKPSTPNTGAFDVRSGVRD